MENSEFKTTFIGKLVSIFSQSTKKYKLTPRQESILGDINDALTFEDTSINVDQIGKKYYVENKRLHFTLCVIGNSDVIHMVNTHDNVEKKFEAEFITMVIHQILVEKHRRMEETYMRMEERVDCMFERIGSIIRKEKKALSQKNETTSK